MVEYWGKNKSVRVGDRVELVSMKDTWTKLKKGSCGTVTSIDANAMQIGVDWDDGSRLALLTDVDKFRLIRDRTKMKTYEGTLRLCFIKAENKEDAKETFFQMIAEDGPSLYVDIKEEQK